ncbi:hypothetical protein [Paraburkholderia sp. MM5477-R1]|uniref:hypothetical protein n=1 Tax=Paraburkholderia sp. MM5477-R1 TaxID=2991062 RepID=UPI003D19E50E
METSREVGTVTGLAALVAGLGNFAFTMTMDWFVSRVGYTPFFVALGFGDLIGASLLWTLVRRPSTTPAQDVVTREARA